MTDPLASFRNGNVTSNSADPKVQAGLNYVKDHGGDPETAGKELLKEPRVAKLLKDRGITTIPSNPVDLAFQLLKG